MKATARHLTTMTLLIAGLACDGSQTTTDGGAGPQQDSAIADAAVDDARVADANANDAAVSDARVADAESGVMQPVGQTSGDWDMVFRDEFSGSALDTSIWEPSWFGGVGQFTNPVNSHEAGCYHSDQVSVSDGTLKLDATTNSDPDCRTRQEVQAGYVSGLINTRNGFLFAYGYVEARMYLPGSGGDLHNWPAFWTDGTGDWPATGEIDIMEGLSGHQPCWHYHYLDGNDSHQGPGGCVDWDDPTGWNVFAAQWEPGGITFFYNGQQVGLISEGVVDAQHFIILNYGLNEAYGINVPSTVEVDYVRVWSR